MISAALPLGFQTIEAARAEIGRGIRSSVVPIPGTYIHHKSHDLHLNFGLFCDMLIDRQYICRAIVQSANVF